MTCLGNIGRLCEQKHVEWEIPNFFSLSTTRNCFYNSPSFLFSNASWHLRIYPEGSLIAKPKFLSVFVENETGTSLEVFFALRIKKTDGTLVGGGQNDKVNIITNRGYSNFYDKSSLHQSAFELVPSGILTIVCTLKLYRDQQEDIVKAEKGENEHDQQNIDILIPEELERLDVLSDDLKQLFYDKDSCDVVLKVKDKEFKAHKAILMARSSVFAAMFKHDTLEKQEGFINIPDCDPYSFQEFLEYLYSGTLSDVSISSAFQLYSTSNKYDVQEIKEFCVGYLTKNVTADDVIDVIIFADKYDEAKLLSASQVVFNENFGKICVTTQWESLMRNDFRLANKILIEMSKAKGL